MNAGSLIAMVLVTLVGMLGLYAAANAVDSGITLFGMVLAAFAVLFDFWMIKKHFDEAESQS